MSHLFLLAQYAMGIFHFVAEFSSSDTDTMIRYLHRYGYLNDSMTSLATVEASTSLHHAIAVFQEYYGLHGKGQLNNVTLNLMQKLRCGLPDIPNRPIGTT